MSTTQEIIAKGSIKDLLEDIEQGKPLKYRRKKDKIQRMRICKEDLPQFLSQNPEMNISEVTLDNDLIITHNTQTDEWFMEQIHVDHQK